MALRWQPFVVAAGLLAPPAALAAAVWPAGGVGGGGFDDDGGSLAVGDEDDGRVGFEGVTTYEITADADGGVRIDVLGLGGDPTLTVLDDDGDQLAYNDDSDGLDSSVELDLDAGEVVHAEVRSFSGDPIAFTIRVTATGGAAGGDAGAGGGTTVPATTIPGDVQPFEAPLEDRIDVEAGGLDVSLYEDRGQVCLDVQTANGGSSSCAGSLEDLAQGGGGISFDGRVSTLDITRIVAPGVVSAVAIDGDEEIDLEVVPLPGRVELLVAGQVRLPGDATAGSGVVVELRAADGAVIDSFRA